MPHCLFSRHVVDRKAKKSPWCLTNVSRATSPLLQCNMSTFSVKCGPTDVECGRICPVWVHLGHRRSSLPTSQRTLARTTSARHLCWTTVLASYEHESRTEQLLLLRHTLQHNSENACNTQQLCHSKCYAKSQNTGFKNSVLNEQINETAISAQLKTTN